MEDTDDTKTCSKCGETKPRSEFGKNRSKRDGLQSYCKPCSREASRKYNAENREAISERQSRYYEGHKEARKEYSRRYHAENKEARNEYHRKYREENPEKVRESQRKYYEANKEAIAEYNAENKEARAEYNRRYRAENKEAIAEYDRKRREERGDDPAYITARRCSRRIVEALRRLDLQRDRSTLEYLGLGSWDVMVQHVESLFAPGMDWSNRDEWDLDHIEPFANVVTHDDFVRVAHHSNVQVLWSLENSSKGTRLDWSPDGLDRD